MYQQNEAESMAALELLHIKNNQPSNLECRSASKLLCNILSSRVDVWGEDSHRIDSSSKVTTKKKKKKKSRASELYDMLYHVLYIYLCTRCVLYFVMHQK